MPDGTTFRAEHTVTVDDLPQITGPKSTRIGVAQTYETSDYNPLSEWSVRAYDTNGNIIYTPENFLYFNREGFGNACNVVFTQPGEYIVRATYDIAYSKKNRRLSRYRSKRRAACRQRFGSESM